MKFKHIAEIIQQEAGPETGKRIAEAIRREASGNRVYIPVPTKDRRILPTDTITDLQRRYGIAKSTAYNWVNQWRK